MATAVQVVFGANSTQFQAELSRMQTLAAASGRRISGSMAGGHGHAGQTGIVRESTVIGREIAMGRGMGRIIASLTLLSQYINTATRNAKQGVQASEMIADAYDKAAVKARLAAIAALKKAEASAIAAEMDGFEDAASIAAADANALEAKKAEQAAVALEAKAVAAGEAAAADEAAAAAAVTAGSAFKVLFGALGVFALLLVIIAELYIAVKGLTEIFNLSANMQKKAAEYAHEHTLTVYEEIEAQEKLKNAMEDARLAVEKMNVAKDRSVEITREAIEAAKAEAEARGKLYDVGVKSKLLDIDIAEKRGLISSRDAVEQRAAVESKSVTEKAAMKQKELDDAAKISADAAEKAEKAKADAQAAYIAAQSKISESPEGKKRTDMLATAEKELQATKTAAEAAKKKEIEEHSYHTTLMNPVNYFAGYGKDSGLKGALKANIPIVGLPMQMAGATERKNAQLKAEAENAANAAASAELRVNSLKRLMKPEEIAAAKAKSVAEERTSSALSLKEEARKTATASAINAKNSPAEVAAEQAEIKKKKDLELLPNATDIKGYSLNSNQKVGAYAATPPILMQQLAQLQRIAANTAPAHAPMNLPPGPKPPQLGSRPVGHKHENGWTDYNY